MVGTDPDEEQKTLTALNGAVCTKQMSGRSDQRIRPTVWQQGTC